MLTNKFYKEYLQLNSGCNSIILPLFFGLALSVCDANSFVPISSITSERLGLLSDTGEYEICHEILTVKERNKLPVMRLWILELML